MNANWESDGLDHARTAPGSVSSDAERRAEVLTQLRAAVKEWSDLADSMGDCGGMQGMAVLAQKPELKKRLDELAIEAERLGITPDEVKVRR